MDVSFLSATMRFLLASLACPILFLGNYSEGLLLSQGQRHSSRHEDVSHSDLLRQHPASDLSSRHQRGRLLYMTSVNTEHRRMGDLTTPERKVYDLMRELSEPGYTFRIVVVGQGAILEATSPLGPITKLTQSPSTGANLLTFASKDQSFEFHLQLSEVSKIALVEKETPAKTLRIIRLLNDQGNSMSSLILADPSDKATAWYHDIIEKRGSEIQL